MEHSFSYFISLLVAGSFCHKLCGDSYFNQEEAIQAKAIIIGRFSKELNSKISSQWQKEKHVIVFVWQFISWNKLVIVHAPTSTMKLSLALSGGVSMGSIGGTFSWTKDSRLGSHVVILHLDLISLRSNSDLYYRNRKWLLIFSLSLAPLLPFSVNVSEQICILKISWN